MRSSMWFIAVAVAASAGPVFGAAVGERYDMTPADVAFVEGSIRDELIDPESARFGAFRAAYTEAGEIMVCGSVNSKNRLGGYTGKVPAHGVLATANGHRSFKRISNLLATESVWLVANQICAKYGL